MARTLAGERKGEFFSWFNLSPSRPAVEEAQGGATHFFAPESIEFRPLVELLVGVDQRDAIRDAALFVARAFIDGRSGPFALDIAKSFLRWAVEPPVAPDAKALIAAMEDSRLAPGRVIVRAPSAPAPPDMSGCVDVFLGRRNGASLVSGRQTIVFVNLSDAAPLAEIDGETRAFLERCPRSMEGDALLIRVSRGG